MHLANNRKVDRIEPKGQAEARFVKKGSFVCAIEGLGVTNLKEVQRAFKKCKQKKCKFIKLTFSKSGVVKKKKEEEEEEI